MTQEPKITAALIYDFDGTLAPGNMQEYDFIPAVGQSNREFWNDANSLAEEQDADREAFLCEHLWELDEIPSSEGIRTERWKYMRYRFILGREELYDLAADPEEAVNLASDPAYGRTLEELRRECDRQIERYVSLRRH